MSNIKKGLEKEEKKTYIERAMKGRLVLVLRSHLKITAFNLEREREKRERRCNNQRDGISGSYFSGLRGWAVN